MAESRRVNPLRTAPNLLTLLRICLTPFLIGAILDRQFVAALVLFVMAACTDAMDGLVARWLEQRTVLGQYLDPAADKLLMSSMFLVLTYGGLLDPRIAIVVFGRDLGMSLAAAIVYRATKMRDFRPTVLGKANSFSQLFAIGTVLVGLTYPQGWILEMRRAALDMTLLLTVVSGFHYAWVVSQRIGTVTGIDLGSTEVAAVQSVRVVKSPAHFGPR